MALLELLYKYCELHCPNEKSGGKYVFVGNDKSVYLEHVNTCHYNEILEVKQDRRIDASQTTQAHISGERYDGNNTIDIRCQHSPAKSKSEKYSHTSYREDSDIIVKQGPCRSSCCSDSDHQVTPHSKNDTVLSPMPERSTPECQISTMDRRDCSPGSDSFPVHGDEQYKRDGQHLSGYQAPYLRGEITPEIAATFRTGAVKGGKDKDSFERHNEMCRYGYRSKVNDESNNLDTWHTESIPRAITTTEGESKRSFSRLPIDGASSLPTRETFSKLPSRWSENLRRAQVFTYKLEAENNMSEDKHTQQYASGRSRYTRKPCTDPEQPESDVFSPDRPSARVTQEARALFRF